MQQPRHMPLIVLLLVAAAAAGFGMYQWLAPMTGPAPTDGTPVAQPQTAVRPMTMDEALGAKYEGLNQSGSHALNEWHGKVVLVNYWATWCAPCREEIPLLVHLQAEYSAQGLQVVGIATDEVAEKDVKAYLDKIAVVNYPMLMGDESVNRMVAGFGGNLIGLPFSVLLDRQGHVLKLYPGQLDPQEAEQLVRMALVPVGAGNVPAATHVAPAPATQTRTTAK
ncbi:MAG TPA: TlpA disulfide reductase family protein [Gammaproteobacteria bacterium]|jgi:thiol-disulfide isomerase/thioredoxin|nr:TlpA disulfide reductase family protein [Gammaproteobacteria bacterium]